MSLRILLVDDNQTFLTAVSQCLSMLPEADVVGQVNSGAEALAKVSSLHPDLMMMDIVMPHMSGLEVAAQLQALPNAPRFLFLSMHDTESYRAAARELGAVALVSKANFVADLIPIITLLAAQKEQAQSELLAAEKSSFKKPRP
ncbi:MAG: response regulator receiver [Comamonadaceae bacterium]|nr:MAG: response regulator receiver [Comamonadaceae bacterium]